VVKLIETVSRETKGRLNFSGDLFVLAQIVGTNRGRSRSVGQNHTGRGTQNQNSENNLKESFHEGPPSLAVSIPRKGTGIREKLILTANVVSLFLEI